MIRFDQKFIDELLSKLNIVDVIGGYCQLTRRGGNYWACCPLPGHSERTPSFAVNESGQFFKCFGCGRGGNAINFVMEMESLDFREAVTLLCEKAHIPLPEDDGSEKSAFMSKKKLEDKDRLKSLMRDTALFYVKCLKSDRAKSHREYMAKRGLDGKIATTFGIGASLDYDSLVNFLSNKGYTNEEMLASGAVQKNRESNKYFDAIATRLVFPIIDSFGNVVAFGGRAIEKTNFAKYKNTSDTQIFNKRKILYNINNIKKLKAELGKLDYVIMVEGYMDTISLHKAGFRNVVASMGTSLTVEQARLLKRYTDTALICYDGDSAGQNATIRGLEILRDNGLEVRVVSLPDGLDPDEIILQRGKDAYQKCLDEALPLTDFKLKIVKDHNDVKSISGKRRYIEESLNIISQCENQSMQEELLKKLRDESGLTFDSLKRDLDRMKGEEGNITPVVPDVITQFTGSNVEIAERFVIDSLLKDEEYAKQIKEAPDYESSDKFRQELMEYIIANRILEKKIEIDKLKDFAGEDNFAELIKILSAVESVDENARKNYFSDCINLLRYNSVTAELDLLKAQFNQEKENSNRQLLKKRIAELSMELIKLKNK